MDIENRLSLLIDSINDDITSLQDIRKKIDELEQQIIKNESYSNKMALALTIHNFYNCAENIFISIAREFGNEVNGNTWHTDLLKIMKLNRTNLRPAVIDNKIYVFLDELRAFRHIVRHSYSFELDKRKMLLITEDIATNFQSFVDNINSFISFIKKEIKKLK